MTKFNGKAIALIFLLLISCASSSTYAACNASIGKNIVGTASAKTQQDLNLFEEFDELAKEYVGSDGVMGCLTDLGFNFSLSIPNIYDLFNTALKKSMQAACDTVKKSIQDKMGSATAGMKLNTNNINGLSNIPGMDNVNLFDASASYKPINIQ